jgi:hypothetical protein
MYLHFRARRAREPRIQRETDSKDFDRFSAGGGQDRSGRELRLALLDKSLKSIYSGGTLVKYEPGSGVGTESARDRITRLESDQNGLRIKTYSKFDLELHRDIILNSDTELREEKGVIYIDLMLGLECYAIAPKGVEIPKHC